MKRILKNRTLIGVLCIVLSLVICFGLTPLFNSTITARGDIVRVRTAIHRGELINASMLEVVSVGTYNLPANLLRTKDEIAGQYALADLQPGDYILPGKLSEKPLAEFEYLSTLDGTKQALSITIKSFALGLSGKLEAGDIVSLIASDYGLLRETLMPPELQYVYVLAVTSGSGYDKEYVSQDQQESSDEERELPSTITVLVEPAQSVLLANLESMSRIHAALVYRGEKAKAQEFLDVQSEYLASLLVEDEVEEDVDGDDGNGQTDDNGTADRSGNGSPEGLDAALSQSMQVTDTPPIPEEIQRGGSL